MADFVGQKLDEYLIVARLGQGGMAQVFKAYQPRLGRYVAVKILHTHLAADPDFVERFQREARACSTLQHPSIVRVFDFSHDADVYYMTMQLVEGPSLKVELQQRIDQQRPLTCQETARICAAFSEALAYAHEQGMVHRDIKPANLTLTHDGLPVILDFGIARILGETQYTMTGALIGSPAYMSPEQGQSARVDGRSDLYSLGVVLYEMVTGRPPFEEDTPMATLIKHITVPVPMPTEFRPDVPPALEKVILKVLAKNPEERFQSGVDLAAALRQAVRLPVDDSLLRDPIKPIAQVSVSEELSPTDPAFQLSKPDTSSLKKPPVPATVDCKNCGTTNDRTTKFCVQCGHQLKVICPSCYWANDPDTVYCANCDFNLKNSIQRKSHWKNEEERWKEERKMAYQKAEEDTFREQLQNLRDPKQHKMAVFSIKQRGAKAVDPLIQLLHDKDPHTRVGVMKALAAIGDSRAIPPIVSRLSDSHPAVRYWAIEALGQLGAVTAVAAIGDCLQDDHKKVQEQALKTLKQFDTAESRAVIKKKSKKWWSF